MTSSFPAAPLTSCSSRLSPDFSRTRVPCAPGPLRPNWAPARGSWPRLPVDRTVPLQVRSFTYPRATLVPGSKGRDHLWFVPCREPRARHAVGPQLRVWLREGTASHYSHTLCLGCRPAGSRRGTPPAPAARTVVLPLHPAGGARASNPRAVLWTRAGIVEKEPCCTRARTGRPHRPPQRPLQLKRLLATRSDFAREVRLGSSHVLMGVRAQAGPGALSQSEGTTVPPRLRAGLAPYDVGKRSRLHLDAL